MADEQAIPIRNLYYMLCYAWDILRIDADAVCGKEPFEDIYNLMARMLLLSVRRLLKQGFFRAYAPQEDTLSTLRGKINMSASIYAQSMQKRQLVCRYDELSADVPFNQIIKATIRILLRYPGLHSALRDELKRVQCAFSSISDIRPTKQAFASLRFDRSNQNYQRIIHICRLVWEGFVANEEDGNVRFADFIRDGQMAKLYEKFVLRFFITRLPQATFRVHAPKICWDIDEPHPESDAFFPEMRTDIVLENRVSNVQLIIDTKFYPEALVRSPFATRKSIRSNHLMQLYTYMGNSRYTGQVKGMLLYPTVSEELDLVSSVQKRRIMIRTLNLASEWTDIEMRLMRIAEETEAGL